MYVYSILYIIAPSIIRQLSKLSKRMYVWKVTGNYEIIKLLYIVMVSKKNNIWLLNIEVEV